MERTNLQVWFGKNWPPSKLQTLKELLADTCDFVPQLEKAEIMLIEDGAETTELGDTMPEGILCVCLQHHWKATNCQSFALRLNDIPNIFELLYHFGLSRAGLVPIT